MSTRPPRILLEGRPGADKTTAVVLERPVAVVATVHAKPDPFTDALKRRASVETLRLTPSNRAELPAAVARELLRDRPPPR